ncbi:hypothetical protein [Burkholderia cenocepacia]|uniref:hypothetical protein n=1 Tax=Burkholderia cenocepacia TaxID=95486 RepID=UPI00223291EF|nr:hypothetical protein [Burkholderia cenocepacia]MCW3678795.1 hypothetical protein [Burkholderia cenocepacia]
MTTDKSRADALTYQEVEALAEKHGFAISAFDYTDSNSLVDLVNDAIRAASRDSLPAAAPIDDNQIQVTHTIATEANAATILHGLLDSFVEVAAAFPSAVIDERLAGQVRIYLPAPSPADERAARLDDAEIDTIAESMPGGLTSFMKQWGWRQFARAVEDEVILNVARAASANETGAEGAKPALPIEGWYVEVAANGERVLCISDDHVAGLDDMEPFAPIVRTAAAHLINFVGAGPSHVGALVALAHTSADTRPTDDELWDQTLSERDTYQEYADKLANAIATHLGVDIGEHSNLNNPWSKALEALESRSPAMAAEAVASPIAGATEIEKPSAVVVTFDEFVQYGKDHGANIVNRMPWSFVFNGHAVTHENDDLYLIGTPSIHFRRGDLLIVTAFLDYRLLQVFTPQPALADAQSNKG